CMICARMRCDSGACVVSIGSLFSSFCAGGSVAPDCLFSMPLTSCERQDRRSDTAAVYHGCSPGLRPSVVEHHASSSDDEPFLGAPNVTELSCSSCARCSDDRPTPSAQETREA